MLAIARSSPSGDRDVMAAQMSNARIAYLDSGAPVDTATIAATISRFENDVRTNDYTFEAWPLRI